MLPTDLGILVPGDYFPVESGTLMRGALNTLLYPPYATVLGVSRTRVLIRSGVYYEQLVTQS